MDKKTNMVNKYYTDENLIEFEWLRKTKNISEINEKFKELFDEYGITSNTFNEVMQGNYFDCSAIDYALIKKGKITIGIIGYYCNKNYPEDMWLGWFGVTKKYRGKGFGSIALKKWQKYISENFKKIKYLRIYTNPDIFSDMLKLYIFNGFIKEKGHYKSSDGSKIIILSKPINDKIKLKNWEQPPIW